MKIIKLEFENMNSLKGPHVIDFKADPLGKAGLFLISGPTGSGKSTILDAITLALFNKIPRFNSSISVREIDRSGSIVTHFESSAKASITFESNNKEYNSTWSLAKNRNNNWNDYHMEIFECETKQIFDLKKSEVPKKNEELIGLNYDQFLKSILLSQGEFAQFLKSDSNSRGALLEKLTGTELYRKIGSLAYERYKLEKEKVQLAIQEIEAISVLSEEELSHEKERLASLQVSVKKKESEIIKLKEELQLKVSIDNLEKEKLDLEKLKSQLETKINDFKPQQLRINIHEQLIPFISDIKLLGSKKGELNGLISEEQELKITISNSKQSLNKAINDLSIIIKKPLSKEDFYSEMQIVEKNYNHLTSKLELLKENGKTLRTKINAQIERIEFLSANQSPVSAIEMIDNALFQYKKDHNQLISNNDEIDDEIENNKKEFDLLSQQISSFEKINSVEKEIKDLEIENEEITKCLFTNQEKLKALQSELTVLKQELAKLEEEFIGFQKIINLNDLRLELKNGDPCPLCGATDHPFVNDHVIYEEGKFSLKIRKLKEDIAAKDLQVNQLNISVSNDNIKLEQNSKSITKKELEAKDLRSQSSLTNDWKYETSLLSLKNIEVRLSKLKDLARRTTQNNVLTFLRPLYSELEDLMNDFKKFSVDKSNVYDGDDLLQITNRIQNEFNAANTAIESGAKVFETIIKKKRECLDYLNTLENKLLPKLANIGIGNVDIAENSIIAEVEFNSLKEKKEALWKENVELQNQYDRIIKQLEKLKATDLSNIKRQDIQNIIFENEKKRDATNQEIGSIHQSLETNAKNVKLIDEKTKLIEDQKKKFEEWNILNGLIGDSTGNKFSNFAQDLTLRTLISITNKNLKLLSDRYVLVSTSITEALSVYDTYQGDTIRSISTLSGGETFIVSLAMAISLSELASRNVKIESIFIDEGFGSLDKESLEQAMVALETFQAYQNKTIGIISHVDTLKERIYTKIQLRKNNRGHSTIQILG